MRPVQFAAPIRHATLHTLSIAHSIATPFTPRSKSAGIPILPLARYRRCRQAWRRARPLPCRTVSINEAFLDLGGTEGSTVDVRRNSWLHSPGGLKTDLRSPCRSNGATRRSSQDRL